MVWGGGVAGLNAVQGLNLPTQLLLALTARMKDKLGGKLREHLRVAGEFHDRLHG